MVETQRTARRPLVAVASAAILALGAVAALALGIYLAANPPEGAPGQVPVLLAAALVTATAGALAWGLWHLKNWARTALILLLALGGMYYAVLVLFDVFTQIFGGTHVVPVLDIVKVVGGGIARVVILGAVPGALIYLLSRNTQHFQETLGERTFVDRTVQYFLIAAAFSAVVIVFLIVLFTLKEAWPALGEIGLFDMILGKVWRPGSIIGSEGQFGMLPMIVGSVLSTFGAVALGVPVSIMTAVLLAEVAPIAVREVLRPAIELLAGIPSVVYGLFGMVVLAPLIRKIDVPYNTGFNILNGSIVLAIMILPTVTNIAEDAIRAVPRAYKEGALALGSTHWQAIRTVILPAARSGILAAVILGIGRALGETMAVIMVMGNAIAMPAPLNDNPLTLFLTSARTLTGNIAVEINYAAGVHRSALFFTGVLLFAMILLVNGIARYLMKERLPS